MSQSIYLLLLSSSQGPSLPLSIHPPDAHRVSLLSSSPDYPNSVHLFPLPSSALHALQLPCHTPSTYIVFPHQSIRPWKLPCTTFFCLKQETWSCTPTRTWNFLRLPACLPAYLPMYTCLLVSINGWNFIPGVTFGFWEYSGFRQLHSQKC